MSQAHAPQPPSLIAPDWSDPQREADFNTWLAQLAPLQGLDTSSVHIASADASFRRYFRIDSTAGSRIIMDAPPDKEDCHPFARVAGLMAQAGVHAPEVLAWDEARGFMLLTDLGTQTMMQVIQRENPQANRGLYLQAIDALIAWQLASRPGVLPPYDEALLHRELQLFPDWYLTRHRGVVIDAEQQLRVRPDFGGAVPKIDDAPWPAFPPDLMSIAVVTATQARGTVVIHEKMYESRLFFVDKLIAMGAQIILCDPHRAVVVGP